MLMNEKTIVVFLMKKALILQGIEKIKTKHKWNSDEEQNVGTWPIRYQDFYKSVGIRRWAIGSRINQWNRIQCINLTYERRGLRYWWGKEGPCNEQWLGILAISTEKKYEIICLLPTLLKNKLGGEFKTLMWKE